MASAELRLEKLSKVYPGPVPALQDLSLDVCRGEYLVLVGPSGCGKTTTLRIVAGLEAPTGGRVYLDGVDATALPPHRRETAMVFQDAALHPRLRVRDNLAFGLKLKHTPQGEIVDRVAGIARRLGLESLIDRRPEELSGGERRRVALGRALVRQPRLLLLDEPLASLDAPARLELRAELAAQHRNCPTTTLHVTHDQEEALALGDRVAVLDRGVLRQVAGPLELYERPADIFVAGFIGVPPMNFFPRTRDSAPHLLGIRPRDITLVAPNSADLTATIETIQPLGHETILGLRGDGHHIAVVVPPGATPGLGDHLGLRFDPAKQHWFDAATGIRLAR